jgi:hypothetical protein
MVFRFTLEALKKAILGNLDLFDIRRRLGLIRRNLHDGPRRRQPRTLPTALLPVPAPP